jgi:acetyl-CoA carboxylase biotin carboxyl carrier protein
MAGVTFDPRAIRALADILVETGLTEIEISEKDSRLRVVRAPAPVAAAAAAVAAPVTTVAVPVAAPVAPLVPAVVKDHPGAVVSPMVGVAYLSPEPAAPPFVSLGQSVTAGQVVLLIEAMKTFNQIKAPIAGRVAQICIQPGSPVEYGEVLMVIEP